MNLNKLTEKAQEAVVAAQREAEQRHHTQLEPEHLLIALIRQDAAWSQPSSTKSGSRRHA